MAVGGDLNPPNLGAFWARIEQEQSNQLCSDWQIQHIELSQTWVVRFPCAVSSKIFKNPHHIGVKRLTSAQVRDFRPAPSTGVRLLSARAAAATAAAAAEEEDFKRRQFIDS